MPPESGSRGLPPARLRAAFVGALSLAACTYGPEERTAAATQVVRLGESYRAVVVVRRGTFRPPTGLAAFPDGGKRRYSRRGAALYLVDAERRDVGLLTETEAGDDVWESFDARVVGLEGDSVGYVRLTGCPKGGECHPALQRSRLLRLSVQGEVTAVDSLPEGVGLPPEMAARRPGERAFVRFGTSGDTVTARFEDGGPAEPLFRVRSDGSLEVLGGGAD